MQRLIASLLILALALLVFSLTDKTGALYAQTANAAVTYFNRGNHKHDRGDLRGAIEDYSAAIAFDPSFAAAYINRANAEFAQSNNNAAIRDYGRVRC